MDDTQKKARDQGKDKADGLADDIRTNVTVAHLEGRKPKTIKPSNIWDPNELKDSEKPEVPKEVKAKINIKE